MRGSWIGFVGICIWRLTWISQLMYGGEVCFLRLNGIVVFGGLHVLSGF